MAQPWIVIVVVGVVVVVVVAFLNMHAPIQLKALCGSSHWIYLYIYIHRAQVITWVAQVLVCNATHAGWLKQLDIYVYVWLKSLCVWLSCGSNRYVLRRHVFFDMLSRPLRSTIVWLICKSYYASISVNASSSSFSFAFIPSSFEHRGAFGI